MCEILVKAIGATHPDPLTDRAGCYKRGDAVMVVDDGYAWGGGELDTSVFAVVTLPGVPAASMRYLLNAELAPLPQSAALKIPALANALRRVTRHPVTRKRYSIDIDTHAIIDKTR